MRRRIAIIMVFLVLGAIVNVAVAWGCAAWLSPSSIRMERHTSLPDTPPFEWWEVIGLLGVAFISVEIEPSSGDADETTHWNMPDAILDGRGWPCIAAWAGYRLLGPESTTTPMEPEGAIAIGLPAVQLWSMQLRRGLPLRVVPFGFFLNTLFYAGFLWLLFFAPFAARRMLRRRRAFRGLCEKCAYPIGVSPVCTECGAAVTRKVEA